MKYFYKLFVSLIGLLMWVAVVGLVVWGVVEAVYYTYNSILFGVEYLETHTIKQGIDYIKNEGVKATWIDISKGVGIVFVWGAIQVIALNIWTSIKKLTSGQVTENSLL